MRLAAAVTVVIVAVTAVALSLESAYADAGEPLPEHVALVDGEVSFDDNAWTVTSRHATLRIDAPGDGGAYRALATIELADTRHTIPITIAPEDATSIDGRAAMRQTIARDADGIVLTARSQRWSDDDDRWHNNASHTYRYWPRAQDGAVIQQLHDDGVSEARSWRDRRLRLRIDVLESRTSAWFDGLLIESQPIDVRDAGPVLVRLFQGDRLRDVTRTPIQHDARYEVIDLSPLANAEGLDVGSRWSARSFAQQVALDEGSVDLLHHGVPFRPARGHDGGDHVDLRRAGWIQQLDDPARFFAPYDAGPPIVHDERMPMIRVPKADYVAMHVLAVAEDDQGTVPRFTIRAGRYSPSWQGQTYYREFVGELPTGDGESVHVRVPMSEAFAQDLVADWIDMTLTRDVRLAVRRPDPSRFQYRPLGLPSGVRIAAVTLERSPLQMHVTSDEVGHAFNEPQVPTFTVTLENITDDEQPYTLEAVATHLRGERVTSDASGSVPAGETATVELPLEVDRGYHDIAIALHNGEGERLLTRRTAMALLPGDTRAHRDTAPWGTWDFSGGHFTPDDPDVVGPLYVKLGMRMGMFGFDVDDLERYGLLFGNEPNAHQGVDSVRNWIERRGERMLDYAQVFHENAISGPHVTRVPDMFHDRPEYELSEGELERFESMWTQATDTVDEVREAFPHLHLRFGNGPAPVREEFYRRGLPHDKFDSAGNESGNFGRMPETQPPNWVAMNAGVWMDRQMLDHYGYEDKPVTLGYEVIYPNTNPGNLTYETQADYMVRHALHALGWEMDHIRPGLITDVGNTYGFGNWGSSGFTRARPEVSVKPSFVSFATMTQVLDGAEFVQVVDAGSLSVHLVEFDRPDGSKAFAMWTIRGERPVTLELAGGDGFTLIDDQARETPLDEPTATLTPSPVYLIVESGELTGVNLGEPDHTDADPGEEGRVVADTIALDDWRVIDHRNHLLEHYNFMSPRRKGEFTFESVDTFAGKQDVVRVTPQPLDHGKPTMPMYAELEHAEGLTLSGEPTEIGVMVHGNSGWGRLIFELTDAAGQMWTSIGAAQAGDASPWLRDWMPEDAIDAIATAGISDWNTDDVFGYSRINFDGWRYLSMPLPGNYPGEQGERYHWPRSNQWRNAGPDGSAGDGEVHYPLTLNKIIVELNEKTLHMTDFVEPQRPEICLGSILTRHGEPPQPRDANR